MSANPKWSMSDAQREAWNKRTLTVTVKEHCPECKQLKEGVKERKNYWPTLSATCCSECWPKLIGQYQGVAVC